MILKNRNIEITEIDAPTNMDTMTERVMAASGKPPKTVPQIFLNGEYIGGADELEAHFKKAEIADDLGGFEL
jgi:glutaredoxin